MNPSHMCVSYACSMGPNILFFCLLVLNSADTQENLATDEPRLPIQVQAASVPPTPSPVLLTGNYLARVTAMLSPWVQKFVFLLPCFL